MGPAYARRQERRRAAKVAAGQTPNPTVKVSDAAQTSDTTAAEAGAELKESEVDAADQEQVVEDANVKAAEKAKTDFPCLICDFGSTWKNGLEIHRARKHSIIDQTDGNDSVANDDETDEDKKYSGTNHYWMFGRLGTVYQSFLDANEIIEKSNLENEIKLKEKEKVLEAGKSAFGSDFRNFPPWKPWN